MKLETLPELPNGWKPDFIYQKNTHIVQVAVREETVTFFYWDGVSLNFSELETYLTLKPRP